jgi:signal transduction histidine kinase
VREALTNVARHAPGASTRVLVQWRRDEVRLLITNGAGTSAGSGPGGGWGVIGMQERVARLGGRMDAGANGEGFVVDVEVPL